MAGSSTARLRQIRCPVCLQRIETPADSGGDERLVCPHCGRAFEKKNALPVDKAFAKSVGRAPKATIVSDESADIDSAPPATPAPQWSGKGGFRFMVGLTGVMGVVMALSYFTQDLNGPDFLVFYPVLFFVTLFGGGIARAKLKQVPGIGLLAWVLFEAVGVIRIITAMEKGMHKFGFLIAMMIVGGIVFLFKFNRRFAGSGRDGDSGFFILGGCGGCGGGGGCGGCGGGGGCGGCGG